METTTDKAAYIAQWKCHALPRRSNFESRDSRASLDSDGAQVAVICTTNGADGRALASKIVHALNTHAELLAALQVVLDQVDYTSGACGPAHMVGACLDVRVIKLARAAIAKAEGRG